MRSSRLLGLAIGLGLIGSAGGHAVFDVVGIRPAEASEFYSRRRVNGVWVTGRFPKAEVDGELQRRGVGTRPEPRRRRAAAPQGAYQAHRTGWARARLSSRGAQRPAGTAAADALIAAALAAAPLGTLAPVATGSGPATFTETATPEPAETRREHLRLALEAKAQELAARPTPGPAAFQPLPEQSATELRPISSTYDYRTQVRTTIYQNGVVLQETMANPTEPALVTRRFVGMSFPRPSGEAPTASP